MHLTMFESCGGIIAAQSTQAVLAWQVPRGGQGWQTAALGKKKGGSRNFCEAGCSCCEAGSRTFKAGSRIKVNCTVCSEVSVETLTTRKAAQLARIQVQR